MLEMEGKGMIITLVDIVSFFDREDIGDVMETLNKIGVNIRRLLESGSS